jgi:hypothetical protein
MRQVNPTLDELPSDSGGSLQPDNITREQFSSGGDAAAPHTRLQSRLMDCL